MFSRWFRILILGNWNWTSSGMYTNVNTLLASQPAPSRLWAMLVYPCTAAAWSGMWDTPASTATPGCRSNVVTMSSLPLSQATHRGVSPSAVGRLTSQPTRERWWDGRFLIKLMIKSKAWHDNFYYICYKFHKYALARTQLLLAPFYRAVLLSPALYQILIINHTPTHTIVCCSPG